MKRKATFLWIIACALFLISGTIDLNNLFDYENQSIPNYITKDNTPASNPITNGGATLGRVLFYDKNLSSNKTISCASCHQQAFAFGAPDVVSPGWNGALTDRHSTRLVNARFGTEENFFWDERANTLEEQTTQPIQNHVEMGFSGTNGDPDINDLIDTLESIDYYQDLFTFVYGDFDITEEEIQDALAQFIRTMQSFDSKFDVGMAAASNINDDFTNFTTQENEGKTLYLTPSPQGGAGCQTCHRAPEFDIDPNSLNNSVITVAGDPNAIDLTNTRSPSLRDLVNPDGSLNGPMMHDGSFSTLMDMIDLYDDIEVDPNNTNLDPRLSGPGGQGQNLNLTQSEKEALEAFLKTLTGTEIYSAAQWSDPFDPDGTITILNSPLPISLASFSIYGTEEEVLLDWSTAQERNNQGFEVQFSTNAIDWQVIGFVDGMGDADGASYYSYTHRDPVAGNNYYRLKQMDFDGKIEYSHTLSQFINAQLATVNVFPNPVFDRLNIESASEDLYVKMVDVHGQIMKEVPQTTSLDVSEMNPGIYFVIIQNEAGREEVFRVLKK